MRFAESGDDGKPSKHAHCSDCNENDCDDEDNGADYDYRFIHEKPFR